MLKNVDQRGILDCVNYKGSSNERTNENKELFIRGKEVGNVGR